MQTAISSSEPGLRDAHRIGTLCRNAFILLTVTILTTGCSMFGHRTVEEASYQKMQQDGNFEIRLYAPLVVAQTDVEESYKTAGSTAFRKLFAYISGENSSAQKIAMTAPVLSNQEPAKAGSKIAMTAPVLSQKEGTAWRFQFVLPATFTIESAPQPTNPDVTLAALPEKKMAVMRYSGRLLANNKTEKAEQLMSWLSEQNLTAVSEPQWAGFDPPWTLPPLRRNEVMIEVQ